MFEYPDRCKIWTKKVQLETRGFCPYFCAVDYPLCDVWMEKTQILIADQREGVDLDKKSTARGFCPYFCAVDHPLYDA